MIKKIHTLINFLAYIYFSLLFAHTFHTAYIYFFIKICMYISYCLHIISSYFSRIHFIRHTYISFNVLNINKRCMCKGWGLLLGFIVALKPQEIIICGSEDQQVYPSMLQYMDTAVAGPWQVWHHSHGCCCDAFIKAFIKVLIIGDRFVYERGSPNSTLISS